MYYDDLEGFGPNRHKTEQNAYPNSERAGAGRDDTGPPASETGQPHGKLHVTLPRVAKSPSCPFLSNLDRERDDEEKNRAGKNQEKKYHALFLRSPARFPARNSPPNLSICSAQSTNPWIDPRACPVCPGVPIWSSPRQGRSRRRR